MHARVQLQHYDDSMEVDRGRVENDVASLLVRLAGHAWSQPREAPSCDVGDSQRAPWWRSFLQQCVMGVVLPVCMLVQTQVLQILSSFGCTV